MCLVTFDSRGIRFARLPDAGASTSGLDITFELSLHHKLGPPSVRSSSGLKWLSIFNRQLNTVWNDLWNNKASYWKAFGELWSGLE